MTHCKQSLLLSVWRSGAAGKKGAKGKAKEVAEVVEAAPEEPPPPVPCRTTFMQAIDFLLEVKAMPVRLSGSRSCQQDFLGQGHAGYPFCVKVMMMSC